MRCWERLVFLLKRENLLYIDPTGWKQKEIK